MACPEEQVREATAPDGTNVHFDAPTPVGGREPYTVECTPASGSIFPIGESTVDCKVTDADLVRAACGFTVRVTVSQTLAHTKFMAFGDSITEGVTSLSPMMRLGPPDTYPYKLEQILLQSYPSQPITVSNQGESGERLDEGAERLPVVLDAEHPEVVLILEGVNAVWLRSTSSQTRDLRTMIEAAQQRGVKTTLATLMPVGPKWEAKHPGSMDRIRALNTNIFTLAAQYNLGNVVDLFSLFEANMYLIGQDDLHPTAEGQTRIAEAFRDEIVRRYETHATMSRR